MTDETDYLPTSIVTDTNYVSLENDCVSVSRDLAFCIEHLTTPETDDSLNMDKVDKAIDCAEALVKIMATFHAGRKVQTDRQALLGLPLIEGSNEPTH